MNGGTIQDAIGNGERRLNLFAGRKVTFVDWSYSTDVSKYLSIQPSLQSASYTVIVGSSPVDMVDFTYEPEKGIYKGTWNKYNSGVLETPADVKAVEEWVLEADVQILSRCV